MEKTNYHTHTTRCNHAYGTDEEYVIKAIEGGYKVLGFSDHAPIPIYSFENERIRMKKNEMQEYVDSILALKEKYKNQIEIYVGLECEYFPDRVEWFKKLKEDYKLDYLILGNHFHRFCVSETYYGNFSYCNDQVIEFYLDDLHQGIKSGIYDMVAHPDLFMRSYRRNDEKAFAAFEQICLWSIEYDIPLEYNLNGLKISSFYPNEELFKIAGKHGCKVIMNGDTHNPEDFTDFELYNEGLNNLMSYGCNVIERLF